MFKPNTTYRIQFHKDFNFKAFDKIIPYLLELGIDTIYASPIFEAEPGSTHGYDVIHPHRINPEIGTEAELFAISKKLKAAGVNWLQDIVPNHMAFSTKNEWLMDVLKNGKQSEYASFFDVNFSDDDPLMVPFLGDTLDNVIQNKELQIVQEDGEFFLSYAQARWPVRASSAKRLKGENNLGDTSLVTEIALEQAYRLCHWQETDNKINYRRFFTVNSLICLNIQSEENFKLYHQYILELIGKGIFQGLRIDHIDGLYDPAVYLERLRQEVGTDIYLVIEKILESKEQLPVDWETDGTTGYDFLAIANNLFTNQSTKEYFNDIYGRITGKKLDPQKLIIEKKKNILFEHMQGELNNLVELFFDSDLMSNKYSATLDADLIKKGIAEMLIQMPVYRFYNYSFPLKGDDAVEMENILRKMAQQTELIPITSLFSKIFIQTDELPVSFNLEKLSAFYQRLMQFTGPLMAKGVEDTVMYTYNRFVGHSEVGDAPAAFGLSVDDFHSKMIDRQHFWPFALNASSTHDTKRGEDFRARINVLTDIPEKWENLIHDLISAINHSDRLRLYFENVHKNDFYLIIQTILGMLPMPGEQDDDVENRLFNYIEKALREAKKRSGWAEPNDEYEQLLKDFTSAILDQKEASYALIYSFLDEISDFGVVNSLSQQLLKFTSPGIPDVYQGTELWDLSLVDPDNRRPVDYSKRKAFLEMDSPLQTLWQGRNSGGVKLWLTKQLIHYRNQNSNLFMKGEYVPLEVKGKYKENIIAYARTYQDKYVVIALPLGMASIAAQKDIEKFDWLDTQVILPKNAPTRWTDVLSKNDGVKDFLNDGILINQLFVKIPLAIIELRYKENKRSAGILMHITSLPSKYGIGDLGEGARQFMDYLSDTHQTYWQILPLNPTKKENGYSPYSCNSAHAGNILLIDLVQLSDDGLLSKDQLDQSELASSTQIDFGAVEQSKLKALHQAYLNFTEMRPTEMIKAYDYFCETEQDWLDDFSLYTAIKSHHRQLEWYNWPTPYKTKAAEAVKEFSEKYSNEINEIKWQQFIFFKQWSLLKQYVLKRGIKIIGDLPFYLDHDSVEVWTNPSLFKLDQDLKPTHVAGVPPDYFNEKGQLWGMPIFNWDKVKENGYQWWLNRLEKNMEMFDLLRLDHFRAFSSYWEVPAGDKDATGGVWQKGAGRDFFLAVEQKFKNMPFIAEDLGEIDDEVALLRDMFNLPGMRVLQFGFGSDLLDSLHIPHTFNENSVAYTGTHDNNTIKGWYCNDIDYATQQRMKEYLEKHISDDNVHDVTIRVIYASVSEIAIIPIQDVLGLDESSRMNVPGASTGNWLWRLDAKQLLPTTERLQNLTVKYGRAI